MAEQERPAGAAVGPTTARPQAARPSERLAFRTRVVIAVLAATLAPLLLLTLLVIAVVAVVPELADQLPDVLVFAMVVVGVLCVPLALLIGTELVKPLSDLGRWVDRVSAGDLAEPVNVAGDDELARLADSHMRLAADAQRRSLQVGRILEAIGQMSADRGVQELAEQAGRDAALAFELIDASVVLGRPSDVLSTDVVPGEPRPLRAVLRVGSDQLGVLTGLLPATRSWARPDQDLFELFASEVAAALRSAELYEAKDEFLRGVSHNLQSPLTSIRAYAEQLAAETKDRRLGIIVDQSQRLSRMVRQLMTVTRLESGVLNPRSEVVNLAARTRRAWEALGAEGVDFELVDRSDGWLALADPDQLDQVLWALLDNATHHGAGSPIRVEVAPDAGGRMLRLTIADQGPGVADHDREQLFTRFYRGSGTASADGGSGLGLYVSRELCRRMGGDLVLDPAGPTGAESGASFSVLLPAERADES
jgi:signal transduction histidine kinase/HAMP domain-containing protein